MITQTNKVSIFIKEKASVAPKLKSRLYLQKKKKEKRKKNTSGSTKEVYL